MATKTRNPLTDQERAARRQADREFAEQAVHALRTSAGWQAWLTARGTFHRYSLRNSLLLAMQLPDATLVAGFRRWLSLGYCVRKGEKALRIWQPVPPTKKQIKAWSAAGANPDERPRTHFKLGPVFDRSQVQACPPLQSRHRLICRSTPSTATSSPPPGPPSSNWPARSGRPSPCSLVRPPTAATTCRPRRSRSTPTGR